MPETQDIELSAALDEYSTIFDRPAEVVASAPGRVNLIGEHTDYNEGFVLPSAIDRRTTAVFSGRDDDRFECYSTFTRERVSLRLQELADYRKRGWFSYVAGVASLLLDRGVPLTGVNCVISSTVPAGAGLSSSAALELSLATGLLALADVSLPAETLIRLSQRAEWDWAGVSCGVMDQFISARAMSGTALLIDCRDMRFDSIPVAPGLALVVCDTKVSRRLSTSEYNARTNECREAVKVIQERFPEVRSLRDVEPSMLAAVDGILTPTLMGRARHVVTENARVADAADALWYGDHARLGELMNASHRSLRDDYAVSSPELDAMADICRSTPGVYGARLIGAGFGGSVLAVVEPTAASAVRSRVSDEYPRRTSLTPDVFECRIGYGVKALRLA